MTAEEIFIKLKDELTAENESSSSPERIFIKNEGQTICTLGMNRSHEIIFVEFKPSPKDLVPIEKEPFVHPHPVEMLHDAGWRQAQLTEWEEAEKLLEIIHRSYKRKKARPSERAVRRGRRGRVAAAKPKPRVEKVARKKEKAKPKPKKAAKKLPGKAEKKKKVTKKPAKPKKKVAPTPRKKKKTTKTKPPAKRKTTKKKKKK